MPPKGYRHLSVKEEVYRRLEEFARSKGLTSVSDALVLLLDFSDIYSKLEYILQRGVSLPQSGVTSAGNVTSISGNTTTGAGNSRAEKTTTSKTKQEKSGGHVWCRKKSEIRNLEGYLNWVKRAYGLVDWWDEGDKYCFETTMPP